MKKPTIAELEAILEKPTIGYFIQPDGSITTKDEEIARLVERIAALKGEFHKFKKLMQWLALASNAKQINREDEFFKRAGAIWDSVDAIAELDGAKP